MGCTSCTCYCCPQISVENEIEVPFAFHSDTCPPIATAHSSGLDGKSSNALFVPNVAIKKTANGIISFQITNVHEIVDAPPPLNNWNLWHFQLRHRSSSSPDGEWEYRLFSPDKVNQNGEFYIRNKVRLRDYQMYFQLRAKHAHFDAYFPFSPPLTVTILSSLIDSEYAVGEEINFVLESSIYTKEGVIARKLDDSYYQIQSKHGVDTSDQKLVRVHSSRVYAAPIFLQFVLDFSDRLDADTNVLLRCRKEDKVAIETFRTLHRLYTECALESGSDCAEDTSLETLRESDAESLGRVVAKYVMEMLFAPHYKEPKVGCLVRGSDEWMQCRPYIEHCLERHHEGLADRSEDAMEANLQELWSYCDVCSVEISRYDWTASCDMGLQDSHVVCLSCLNTRINQKSELPILLNDLLAQHLYPQLVEQIVEFVVGRVIVYEPLV